MLLHKYLPTYKSTNQSSQFNLCFLLTYLTVHVTYMYVYMHLLIFLLTFFVFAQILKLRGEVQYRKTLITNNGLPTGAGSPVGIAVDPARG